MSLEHDPARQRKGKSITRFCSDWDISRSLFYRLRKEGKAPAEMAVGERRIISPEAEEAWRIAREQDAREAPPPRPRGRQAATKS